MTFPIKRGDRLPALATKLKNGDGTIPDLTGATVVLSARVKGSSVLRINRATVVIVDQPTASVRYDWQTGDTAEIGELEVEFEVTFGDTRRATFPNNGFIAVSVNEDLA